MPRLPAFRALLGWGGLILILYGAVAPAAAGAPEKAPAPGVHVLLSREFFEALRRLERPGVAYGDRQELLLERIALSCEFLVKTNLTLLQQQERLLRLLEEEQRLRAGKGK